MYVILSPVSSQLQADGGVSSSFCEGWEAPGSSATPSSDNMDGCWSVTQVESLSMAAGAENADDDNVRTPL